MNILVIDTSTSVEIVAAASDDSFSDQTRAVTVTHSATLFESIDKALKGINAEPDMLDIIGVGIGPGSFTGIRIAVTTARMLSQILNVPLVGIKSQRLYACSALEKAEKDENILIAFDARKGKVFGALYRNEKELAGIMEPGDYKIEDLLDCIGPDEKTLLIGDGCKKFEKEIKLKISKYRYLHEFKPEAGIICNEVKKIFLANPEEFRDFEKIVPFYSRASDAELSKK